MAISKSNDIVVVVVVVVVKLGMVIGGQRHYEIQAIHTQPYFTTNVVAKKTILQLHSRSSSVCL